MSVYVMLHVTLPMSAHVTLHFTLPMSAMSHYMSHYPCLPCHITCHITHVCPCHMWHGGLHSMWLYLHSCMVLSGNTLARLRFHIDKAVTAVLGDSELLHSSRPSKNCLYFYKYPSWNILKHFVSVEGRGEMLAGHVLWTYGAVVSLWFMG